MDDKIKYGEAKRKSAPVLDMIQGKTSVAEAFLLMDSPKTQ
ncbi:hypothetical protein ACVFVO_04090 [Advenella kashmirensis]